MSRSQLFITLPVLCLLFFQCNREKKESSAPVYSPVKITTRSMEFSMPDSIPSGWNTFQYDNKSGDIHFFVLEKLPEGITLEDYKRDIISVFETALDYFSEGKMEEGSQEFGKIPEWFSRVENVGGVGLLGPQSIAEATFFLEPGNYAIECYVRMPNGRPHALMGMFGEITVTDSESMLKAPDADLPITISSTVGIEFNDTIPAGDYSFSVYYDDQQKYENMMGHDVNLVRLDSAETDITVLANWMNAADFTAFRTPAPAGFAFLGGIQELPAGQTGYFTASLGPGSYVLISEVPQALSRKLYKRFEVIE